MVSNKCCVPGCQQSSTSKFGVPQNERNAWEKKIGEGSSQYTICLRQPRLKKGVIPSIFPSDLAYNICDKVNNTLVTSILEEHNYCIQKRNLLCLNIKPSSPKRQCIELADDFIVHYDVSEKNNFEPCFYINGVKMELSNVGIDNYCGITSSTCSLERALIKFDRIKVCRGIKK
ncbi:hypothetical protein AGLY_001505 [Aphis glycines]|uniref:THAP-type domain-containing protein n=1 Tax=Aphis glycines TaxID=307491 RepID=A0A6G0U7X9_APHGL|nr:hypothetical protein AGLY_001505 [Aphis glycines]